MYLPIILTIGVWIVVTSASTMTTVLPSNIVTAPTTGSATGSADDGDDAAVANGNEMMMVTKDPFEHPLVPPTLPVSQWPHQSVLLQVGSNTRSIPSSKEEDAAVPEDLVPHTPPPAALPIGVPFPFETPNFRGQFLVRLRDNTSDDPKSHHAYFRDRKRVLQTVVQGQFKKNIAMSDLYVGTIFRQPMKHTPPPCFMPILRRVFHKMSPGVMVDFASKQPRVWSLYGGAARAISIDRPGEEPDIRSIDLPESLENLPVGRRVHRRGGKLGWSPALGAGHPRRRRNEGHNNNNANGNSETIHTADLVHQTDHHQHHHHHPSQWSPVDRQRILSNPDTACHYMFDTEHVYTMEIYDELMDYGKYTIALPKIGNFQLTKAIGRQPMTFTAVTKQNDIIYDFALWHESIMAPPPPRQ